MEPSRAEVLGELDRLRGEVIDLRAAGRRLVIADDAERGRLERDLHRGVQQHLVALAVTAQLAAGLVATDPPAAMVLLSEMVRDLELAAIEARELAASLYPPLLDAGGLAVAIRSEAAHAKVRARISVDPGEAWPPEVVRAVCLCCREVFVRAAGRAQAVVSVREEGAELAFEIIADCDPSDLDEHRLRDRVEALGGRLAIGAQADGRVRVAGSMPRAE